MGNYLDYNFEVSSADIDVWGSMKPTSLLAVCQDVAYIHSSSNGLGFDMLLSQNLAWVLSRVKVEIDRLPLWHDKIRVRTWHKGQSGLFALRDYIFYDADDVPIVRVTTSWLIINLATRRISRVDKVFADGGLTLAEYKSNAIEAEAERIDISSECGCVGEHRVLYSDLDVNNHVNNTKYVEWACDYSLKQMNKDYVLKGFNVNFNHEAKYNDVVALSSTSQESDRFIIEGSISQRNIFAIDMQYCLK